MTPELLEFGITSLVRIGKAGKTALEQAARDEAVLFPRLQEADFSVLLHVNGYFSHGEAQALVTGNGPYAHLWDADIQQAKESAAGVETLLLASIQRDTERGDPRLQRNDLAAGSLLVRQWNPKQEPVSPWITVMLTAADIALEYVAENPDLLDVDEQSAKIISAYARELSELLPDDGEFGAQDGFASRLGASFLKAGLGTVAANPAWVTSETHLQALLKNTLAPLLQEFPQQTLVEQMVWSKLADSMMGPVAAAAFETIAAHQVEFLGADFAVNEALGAVTQAVFLEMAEDGLQKQFTEAGLLGVYRAVMSVAVENPALFIDGDKPRQEVAREALSGLAGVLRDADSFDGQLARELAASAISIAGANAARFAEPGRPWHAVAADVISSLTTSISDNIVNSANTVLSKSQAIEIGRVVLLRIGSSPELVARERWEGVVKAIAQAMAADEQLLLGGSDWTVIASVAADEAAANPQRLFKLQGDSSVLAGQLISAILAGASQAFLEPQQAQRTVLYGATLREAVLIAIRAGGGKPKAVRERLPEIRKLVRKLDKFVSENNQHYGNKEWLSMFQVLLQAVLSGAAAPDMNHHVAEELLKGSGL